MKAFELIEKPEHWTKRVAARDKAGHCVAASDVTAVSFCILGAIFHCYPGISSKDKFSELRRKIGKNVDTWNDAPCRTHAEVVSVLKELNI